jgi:hypothetical protein
MTTPSLAIEEEGAQIKALAFIGISVRRSMEIDTLV